MPKFIVGKIRKKFILLSEGSVSALAKTALKAFAEGLALRVGAVANVPMWTG